MTPNELKQWRESIGMTQLEFSQWLEPKRTPTQVSRWESGYAPIPGWVDAVKKLSELKK